MAENKKLSPERRKLVEDNMSVVDEVMRSYVRYCTERGAYEDMKQIGYLALCNAAIAYDENASTASFRTYAYRAIYNTFTDTFSAANIVEFYEPVHYRASFTEEDKVGADDEESRRSARNNIDIVDYEQEKDVDLAVSVDFFLQRLREEVTPKIYLYVRQFVESEIEGIDAYEIARRYNVCYGTARTNIFRGKKLLREDARMREIWNECQRPSEREYAKKNSKNKKKTA